MSESAKTVLAGIGAIVALIVIFGVVRLIVGAFSLLWRGGDVWAPPRSSSKRRWWRRTDSV